MPDELQPREVIVRDTPVFTGGGTVRHLTEMRFYVGPHGPFTRYFDVNEARPEHMKGVMDHEAAELRRLTREVPFPFTVSEQTALSPAGDPQITKVLSFKVDNHGPFTQTFVESFGVYGEMQRAMEAKQAMLRSLTT